MTIPIHAARLGTGDQQDRATIAAKPSTPNTPQLILIVFLQFAGLVVASPCDVWSQTTLKYDALSADFQRKLQDLAERCQQNSLEAAAATMQSLIFARDPYRQYFFIPPEQSPWPDGSVSSPAQDWEIEFRNLRMTQAAQLLELAKQSLAQGEGSAAFAWLHEVCSLDPDNAEARRILGYHSVDNRWLTGPVPISVKRANVRHKLFDSWEKDTYQIIESPHYQIASRAVDAQVIALANDLERWRIVWRQAFFDYWSNADALAKIVAGESSSTVTQKYKVVLFANRNDYIQSLANLHVDGVERSTGFYSDRHDCLFLYVDDPQPFDTWKHEQAHQLFQEIPFAHGNPVERSHVWLLEGIAMYFESLVDWGQFATLGGFDHGRLQFARINLTREGFFRPFDGLTRLSRSEFQQSTDVSKLYSQAAGMTHFLMASQNGRYRPIVIPFLKLMYQRRAKLDSLEKLSGESTDGLESQYKEFLKVDPENVRLFLSAAGRRTELALGFSDIDSSIGPTIAHCNQLRWLQLSATRVDDELGPALRQLTRLEQLFLDHTNVSDRLLESLVELTDLEELDLAYTRVTDDGMKFVAGLPRLKALWLSGTKISDEGLRHLESLQQLQLLDVQGTEVSPQALRKLKQYLPQLTIIGRT